MKYLKRFETETQCTTYMDNEEYIEPFVGLVDENGDVHYNKKEPYLEQYLTFNVTSPGYINWSCWEGAEESAATIEYSKNGGEWTSITALPYDQQTMQGAMINVAAGDIVMFRGDNNSYSLYNSEDLWLENIFGSFAYSTCGFNLEGNLMSLINSENFSSMRALDSNNNGAFADLFSYCDGITSVENDKLIFPTGLTYGCFADMFVSCSNLNYINFTGVTQTVEQLKNLGCFDGFAYSCAENGSATISDSLTSLVDTAFPYTWFINGSLFDKSNMAFAWMSYGTFTDELTITTNDITWTASTEDWISLSQNTGGIGETEITVSVTISQEFHPDEETGYILFNFSNGNARYFKVSIAGIK